MEKLNMTEQQQLSEAANEYLKIMGTDTAVEVEAYKTEIFTIQPLHSVYAGVYKADAVQVEGFEKFTDVFARGVLQEIAEVENEILKIKKISEATEDELILIKDPTRSGRILRMWNLANYRKNGTSAGTNIIDTHGILIDIDDTDKSLEYITASIKRLNVDFLLVSSLRHKEDRVKVHIIFPTSEAITDAKTYKRTWKRLANFFSLHGIEVDTQVSDWTRRLYLVSSGVFDRNLTGRAIKPMTQPTREEREAEERRQHAAKAAKFSHSFLKRLDLEHAAIKVGTAPEGARNDTLNTVLWMLKERGAKLEDLRAVASASNVENESELRATFKSATGYDY